MRRSGNRATTTTSARRGASVGQPPPARRGRRRACARNIQVAHLGARRLRRRRGRSAARQPRRRCGCSPAAAAARAAGPAAHLDAHRRARVREVGLGVSAVTQPRSTRSISLPSLRQHGSDVLGGDAPRSVRSCAAGPLREPDQGHHQREQQQVEPQQPPIEASAVCSRQALPPPALPARLSCAGIWPPAAVVGENRIVSEWCRRAAA